MNDSQQPLVSIIICFYNDQEFIDRCLNSVLKQEYKNLQVIVVDDGSTDDSLSVANKYANQFQNYKLISINNAGLGNARNEGLKLAAGEYVTFLDADDALERDMIQRCVHRMVTTNTDLVISRFTLFDKNEKKFSQGGWNDSVGQMTNAASTANEVYKFNVSCTAWGKLYKTVVAKQVKFPVGVWFEDRPFLLEYLLSIDKVSLIDDNLLRIYNRESSITRRMVEPKRIIDSCIVFELEMEVLKKLDHAHLKHLVTKHHLHSMLDNFLLIIIDGDQIKDKQELYKVYSTYISKTQVLIDEHKVSIAWRDRINILLLKSPAFLGWGIATMLLRIVKTKRFAAIMKLKN